MTEEHKGKKVKPKPNHPWRTFIRSDVSKWAYEKSKISHVGNYKRGGGKPQK